MAQYLKMSVQSVISAARPGEEAAPDDFILIEVDDRQGGGLASVDDAMNSPVPSGSFEKAVAKLGPVARAVLAQVKGLGLSEVQIELGIKFAADVGIILAKTSGEGTCKVSIGWKLNEQKALNSSSTG